MCSMCRTSRPSTRTGWSSTKPEQMTCGFRGPCSRCSSLHPTGRTPRSFFAHGILLLTQAALFTFARIIWLPAIPRMQRSSKTGMWLFRWAVSRLRRSRRRTDMFSRRATTPACLCSSGKAAQKLLRWARQQEPTGATAARIRSTAAIPRESTRWKMTRISTVLLP